MQWILHTHVFFIISSIDATFSFTHNCFLNGHNYRCRLGTKTPYRFVQNHDDSPIKYLGCVPQKIWIILRHGTRYPGKKYIGPMIEKLPKMQRIILDNYEKNKTVLAAEDIDLFKDWKIIFNEEDIMKLAIEGENEMIDLGERYQSRFPTIMLETYENETYKFKYTATQRAEESAKNFATGLFGRYQSHKVHYPEAEHQDAVLRFLVLQTL